MRILFCGNGERGIVCLDALMEAGHSIVAVVANPDPAHRMWYRSFASHARERNLVVHQPQDVNEPAFVIAMKALHPDLTVLAGYSQIVKKDFIQSGEKGCINLHGGMLPEYRGSSPINWAVVNGEPKGGISVIFVREKIDMGDIIARSEFEIAADETAKVVLDRTLQLFPRLLLESIKKIEDGTVVRIPQRPAEGVYYPMRTPDDGLILWDFMTASEIFNLVRGVTHPFPGAFTFYEGKKLFIWKCSLLDELIRGIPGRLYFRRSKGVVVMARDRALLIERVQEQSKEELPATGYFERMGGNFSGVREYLLSLQHER